MTRWRSLLDSVMIAIIVVCLAFLLPYFAVNGN